MQFVGPRETLLLVLVALTIFCLADSYRLNSSPAALIRKPFYLHATDISSKEIQDAFDKCEIKRTGKMDAIFRHLYNLQKPKVLSSEELDAKQKRDAKKQRRRLQERPADVMRRNIEEETAKWRKHDDDVGSSEYQIAMLTVRIRHLTTHFLKHKQDKHGKRGMTALVHQRRKLMNYLYSHDKQKALDMAKALDFTFRPNDRPWDSKVKYGSFTKTKNVFNKKGKLVKVKTKNRTII